MKRNSAWNNRTYFPAHERAYLSGRMLRRETNDRVSRQRSFGHHDETNQHHPNPRPRKSKTVGGLDSRGLKPGAFDLRLRGAPIRRKAA